MFVSDRVVVRYRLGPGAPGDWRTDAGGAHLSDVTGIVVDDGDPLVLTRVAPAAVASDDFVRIPVALITSVRLLSYRAVRNSEIRDVARRAVTGTDTADVSGWLARAGDDGGAELNSAVPARVGAVLDATTIEALRRWYADRGLPAIVELPERLVANADAGVPVDGEFHRLIHVDEKGTESSIATVDASDAARGVALREQGFRLHHRVTYRRLD